jgi:hypothetical protein
MNKTLAIITLATAIVANPFVGEHQNSQFVNHPNGRTVSAKLETKVGVNYSPHKFVTNNNKRHMTLRE